MRLGEGCPGRGLVHPLLVMALLVAAGACTSSKLVKQDRLVPGSVFTRAAVYLSDGSVYQFPRVSIRPDTLVGEYPVAEERRTEREISIETEYRGYPFALARVDSVTLARWDVGKSLLAGAGLAAAGFVVREIVDGSLPGGKDSPDHTKPPPK
jgi:hypothetical protein